MHCDVSCWHITPFRNHAGASPLCISPSAAEPTTVFASFRLWILNGIDNRPTVAYDGAGCEARHIDMRFSENVHHLLACGQKVVSDDLAVAPPPDRFGAHDHAPLLRTASPELRQAGSEWRRQSIVSVVAKAAHSPVGIERGFDAQRLSAQAAELADMLVTDLPRCERFGEALLIELRIGARPGHRPYVDNEADTGLPQEIDKFDDRPGRVAYGEKGVRVVAPNGA